MSSNSIANSSGITLAGGATFDVSGLSSGTFVLGNTATQTLAGPASGTANVAGNLTVGSLGTIYGASGGTLAIGGTLNLAAGSSASFTLPTTGPGSPIITAERARSASEQRTRQRPRQRHDRRARGPYAGRVRIDRHEHDGREFQCRSFGAVPHNWSLTTTLNAQQLDLVVARSDTTLTATDQNVPSGEPGTQAVWSVATSGAGSSFAGLASGAATVDPGTPAGAAGHGGPLLTNSAAPLMATILAGNNSGTYTGGSAATVTEQWRTRTLAETSAAEGGSPASPPLAPGAAIVSNVLEIEGMGTASSVKPRTGANGIRTDPFVLSMDYDAQLLASEAAGQRSPPISAGSIPPAPAAASPQWQNAVLGNFGAVGADADPAEYQGSFTQFIDNYEFARDPSLFPAGTNPAALDDAQLAAILGSFGMDTTDDSVWAALDHNSGLAAIATFQSDNPETVPEPSGAIPLVLGIVGLLCVRRRICGVRI